jgi:hypothetical protein
MRINKGRTTFFLDEINVLKNGIIQSNQAGLQARKSHGKRLFNTYLDKN